jgi:anti-sigma regulatory factor (Ser/Thr protein kinase)
MIPTEHRVFPARMTMLAETAAFVEAFCARHGIGRDDGLRLTLIVEELFTNTVAHGHKGDSDAPIGIALAKRAGDVELFYEDNAPAHDPLARLRAPPPSLAVPVEERPVGGLGMHLVGQLAHSARYACEDGRNRLWIVLTLSSATAPPDPVKR